MVTEKSWALAHQWRVLILVVVEYGHGEQIMRKISPSTSLNPCCGGIWSRRQVTNTSLHSLKVLILVVVEYGHGETKSRSYLKQCRNVLILGVVEYGLGATPLQKYIDKKMVVILVVVEYGHGAFRQGAHNKLSSLNPCCGGIWSRRASFSLSLRRRVLILVVVEYGHGVGPHQIGSTGLVLILVVVEYGHGDGHVISLQDYLEES